MLVFFLTLLEVVVLTCIQTVFHGCFKNILVPDLDCTLDCSQKLCGVYVYIFFFFRGVIVVNTVQVIVNNRTTTSINER